MIFKVKHVEGRKFELPLMLGSGGQDDFYIDFIEVLEDGAFALVESNRHWSPGDTASTGATKLEFIGPAGIGSKREGVATEKLLMVRAKELQRSGYIVLVSTTVCPHGERWTGYTAFHPDRPREHPIRLECDVPLKGDPHALYVLDS